MTNLRREWGLLSNLPKISVMEGSPNNRADLRAVKVNLARTVILLSAMVMYTTFFLDQMWVTLSDVGHIIRFGKYFLAVI